MHLFSTSRLLPISLFLFVCLPQAGLSQDNATAASYLNAKAADSTDATNAYSRAANMAAAMFWNAANMNAADASEDVWAARHLVADRKKREVRLVGEMTEMNPGEPMEFFIISLESGHSYESLTTAYADPEDVHVGLEFIGLKAGTPVVFSELQFWPKGDRVAMNLTHMADGKPETLRIEDFAYDNSITNSAERSGLIFVGSRQMPHPTNATETVYGASHYGPKAIAANFNCIETVLDLPFRKQKAEVYGEQIYHTERALPEGLPVILTLKAMENQPAIDLNLAVSVDDNGVAAFALTESAGKVLNERGSALPDILASFERLTSSGAEPYLSVDFAEDVPLKTFKAIAPVLKVIDSPTGVRIDPPLDGQIYYESYAPPEEYRTRESRPTQPWEYRVAADGSAVLTYIREDPQPDFSVKLTPEDMAVNSADDVALAIQKHGNRRAIFVFAAEDASQKHVLQHLRPHLKDFGTIFVYTDEPAGAEDAPDE